jgi:hypothetical protein
VRDLLGALAGAVRLGHRGDLVVAGIFTQLAIGSGQTRR